jgi:hypothetical protein
MRARTCGERALLAPVSGWTHDGALEGEEPVSDETAALLYDGILRALMLTLGVVCLLAAFRALAGCVVGP